jgi:hypothetical protein
MADNETPLSSAARAIGRAAGKVAKIAGVQAPAGTAPVPEDLYKAQYLGSGTFIIKKPKRKSGKIHQSRVKSPQRGARK